LTGFSGSNWIKRGFCAAPGIGLICGMLFLVYKPFGVLSQFTDPVGGKQTLAGLYDFPKNVYPIGRLDEDSEGLLLLSDEPQMNARVLRSGMEKEYWVQVEGIPDAAALKQLEAGVTIRAKKQTHTVSALSARILEPPPVMPPRNPPIRYRATVPDTWISLLIDEGKNRQVRRMTAAVGHPTLRLVRWRIGSWTLDGMEVGEVRKWNKKSR
jgi:23S rRNA pseudouridine2457 synthase